MGKIGPTFFFDEFPNHTKNWSKENILEYYKKKNRWKPVVTDVTLFFFTHRLAQYDSQKAHQCLHK